MRKLMGILAALAAVLLSWWMVATSATKSPEVLAWQLPLGMVAFLILGVIADYNLEAKQ
jgi:membrane protein implicated in regulation of membrane protease activity